MLPKIKLSQKGKWKELHRCRGRMIETWANQRLRKRQAMKMKGMA
jgi:hypothetical protein